MQSIVQLVCVYSDGVLQKQIVDFNNENSQYCVEVTSKKCNPEQEIQWGAGLLTGKKMYDTMLDMLIFNKKEEINY